MFAPLLKTATVPGVHLGRVIHPAVVDVRIMVAQSGARCLAAGGPLLAEERATVPVLEQNLHQAEICSRCLSPARPLCQALGGGWS